MPHGDFEAILSEIRSATKAVLKYEMLTPKADIGAGSFEPSSAQIDEALTHRRAPRKLCRHGDTYGLAEIERKSLSAFNFGSSSWVLSPEM